MRFTRASLLGVILLAVGLASHPGEARTASREGAAGGGVQRRVPPTASEPPAGDGTAVRRLRGCGQDATGRRASRPPHHAQGTATWGHGGYYGHGGYGYPTTAIGLSSYGYPYYGYPCGWWGGYYPYVGLGVSFGWGLRRGYAEPVPARTTRRSLGGARAGRAGLPGLGRDGRDPQARVRPPGRRGRRLRQGLERRLGSSVHPLGIACPGVLAGGVPDAAGAPRCPAGPRLPRPPGAAAGGGSRSPSSTEASRLGSARGARRPPGFILLSVEPGDAAVYLDGKFVGRASDLHLRRSRPLPSGEHALRWSARATCRSGGRSPWTSGADAGSRAARAAGGAGGDRARSALQVPQVLPRFEPDGLAGRDAHLPPGPGVAADPFFAA